MRRIYGATTQDHFTRSGYMLDLTVSAIRDTATPEAIEAKTGGDSLGNHPQIFAAPGLGEKGLRGRAAKPAAARHLRVADPLLHGPIVIRGQLEPGLLCCFDKTMG